MAINMLHRRTMLFEKSLMVPFAQNMMFDLVMDVPNYPNFLPECTYAACVQTLSKQSAVYDMTFKKNLLHLTLTTRNTWVIANHIAMALERSNRLKRFEGDWYFKSVNKDATEVTLRMCFDGAFGPFRPLIEKQLTLLASSMMDNFLKQAYVISR
jgi:ribosome-associated toxin RatA of RatAB toxin-antitoxin module